MPARGPSGDALVDGLFDVTSGSGIQDGRRLLKKAAVLSELERISGHRPEDTRGWINLADETLLRACTSFGAADERLLVAALALSKQPANLRGRFLSTRTIECGPPRTVYRHLSRLIPALAEILRSTAGNQAPLEVPSPPDTSIGKRGPKASPPWIGVLAPLSGWPTQYYLDIIRGIGHAIESDHDHKYRLLAIDTSRELQTARNKPHLPSNLAKDLAGIITINLVLEPKFRRSLVDSGVPAVSINHRESDAPFVSSIIPEHQGFQGLLEDTLVKRETTSAVLITKGLANPLKGVPIDPFRQQKRDLFSLISTRAGLKLSQPMRWSRLKGTEIEVGTALVLEVDEYDHSVGLHLPGRMKLPKMTAIICLADIIALGLIGALSRRDVTVRSEALRLTGFDNLPQADAADLTSVDYNLPATGRAAYQQLAMAIDFPGTVEAATIVIQDQFKLRGSSSW